MSDQTHRAMLSNPQSFHAENGVFGMDAAPRSYMEAFV